MIEITYGSEPRIEYYVVIDENYTVSEYMKSGFFIDMFNAAQKAYDIVEYFGGYVAVAAVIDGEEVDRVVINEEDR